MLFGLLAIALSVCPGWENVCPARRLSDRVKVLWEADFSKGAAGFALERQDGAEGEMSFVDGRLVVRKANARGQLVVRAKDGFSAPTGFKLKSFADAEVSGSDSNYSLAYPRIVDSRNSLCACFELDAAGVFMGGGEKIAYLANTPPGVAERRFSHFKVRADGGTNLVAALVVAGAPSTTTWHRWGVQDYAAAHSAWAAERARFTTDGAGKTNLEDRTVFGKRLAADIDHTAKIVKRDGRVRLLVDGKDVPPVLYKTPCNWGLPWGDYNGRAFAREGVRLQVIGIGEGQHWTNGTWDVDRTIRDIRDQMRTSPESLAVITICLSTPREYAERHPDEQWRQPDGTPCVGEFGHMHSRHCSDPGKKPYRDGGWPWISVASKIYRRDMERIFGEIIARLKAEGLAKRIVGFHVSGWHDGQFAMYRADYSKPAREGFRAYLKEKYGTAPEDLELPVPGRQLFYDPKTPEGRLAYDFNVYQHLMPIRFQNDFARFLKKAMAKDIFCVHWCMSVFGGQMNAGFYLDEFLKCDAMDGLVAQPSYVRRLPGNSIATPLPLDSFNRHDKLYLDEFDLRAWGEIPGFVKEESMGGLGFAMNLQEWQAVYRKMAGRMMAKGQGFWFFDISGGFWNPDEIERDIGSSVRTYADLRRRSAREWHPSAAFVTDAKGLLWRNMVGVDKHPDGQALVDTQRDILAASGVPYEAFTFEDVMLDGEALATARVVVLAGFLHMDEPRRKFLTRLLAADKTIVLLAGTDGFAARPRRGVSLETVAVDPARQQEFMSRFHAEWQRWYLGLGGGPLVQETFPNAYSFDERPGTEVLARYATDGQPAVIRRGKVVAIGQSAGLTPRFFNRLVREAGGYVPVDKGLQVDMNGSFVSLVALDNGHFDFRLPFACRVTNLKTDAREAVCGDVLSLDMTAGEVRWYELER